MGIKITTNTESKEPTEYRGLTWFDTPDAKEQYNDAYSKYKQHYDGFFNQFKGGEKDNIYQEFLNLKDGVSPMDIALDHDLGLDYLKYEHELANNPQAKLDKEHFLKFNSKDKSLIPENFNMDNWISDLNDQSNDVKSYVDSLYNQKRSQRYFNHANRYAKKRGAQNWVTEMEGVTDVDYSPDYNSTNTNGKIIMGLNGEYPFDTTLAHEIAHGRNLYNKRTLDKHSDSEYYGNDYSYIKNRHKKWLEPENPRDEHDAELSEQYSDLMGLRRSMYDAGIVDGTKRRYRNRDIDRFRETELGKNNRYLEYHSNRRNIRRALNRIYQVGGILKIQNGGFTTKQQEDNKAFFEDFSERYNKLHGVDKSSAIQETLEKETPVIDPNGKGNLYYPHKDEIHLVSTNSPAHFTHEFVHKLNDSLPPRLERSQEEVDLLTEAYPLGKLQNSTKRYQKQAGKSEHFTTNTTLRRNISDKNNGVLGEDLNKVILEMPAKELGIEAGGSGYASPRDYFEFKPEVNSVESYYKAMGNETPWESLKRKEKKDWNWQYENKIGVDKIGVPNEELINKVRNALIKVAGTNNIDLSNHG